uniref:TBC1 domain family, member 10b n=1 Tax=Sinocyclocheilus anshuiensis TaxID=1608454 RepID=A0A671P9U1_9TELE
CFLMSGTLESLSGLGEDGSSFGSDSEINGPVRRTDKYGFLGGAHEADIAVAVARQREMKWLDMFRNWDKWISRRFPKVKVRCRKGIPSSLRCKAWQLLSNSQDHGAKSTSPKFIYQGDPKWLDIIEKDLHRQFPFHEMFPQFYTSHTFTSPLLLIFSFIYRVGYQNPVPIWHRYLCNQYVLEPNQNAHFGAMPERSI